MPVATAVKVEALRRDLRSGAAVADLLGVSRSRVTRWLQGAGIDPMNAERVDLLELVWSGLLRVYEPEAAREWLLGANPNLDDRRPIDLVRAGRAEELMRAIRAGRTGRSGSRACTRARGGTTTPKPTAASTSPTGRSRPSSSSSRGSAAGIFARSSSAAAGSHSL